MVATKKVHKNPFKVELKKAYTHDSMLVNDKDIILVDPDYLKDGETYIDNPPSRGYTEVWMQGITQYDVYPLSINQLNEHLANNTLTTIKPIGRLVCPSEFACVCNSRNRLKDNNNKSNCTYINQWSGKIYTRVYDVLITVKNSKYQLSFVTFEGVKSGRKSTSFVCWPNNFTTDFLSNIIK